MSHSGMAVALSDERAARAYFQRHSESLDAREPQLEFPL